MGLVKKILWGASFLGAALAQDGAPKNGDEFTIPRGDKGTITYQVMDGQWSYRTDKTTKKNHWIPTGTAIEYNGKILASWKNSQPTSGTGPEPDPELESDSTVVDTSESIQQAILDLENKRLASEPAVIDSPLVKPKPLKQESAVIDSPLVKPKPLIQEPAVIDSPLVKPKKLKKRITKLSSVPLNAPKTKKKIVIEEAAVDTFSVKPAKPKLQPKPIFTPKIKPTVAEGVQRHLTESFEAYTNADATLYRALQDGIEGLDKSMGNLKTLEDDDHPSTMKHIKYIRQSLQNAVDDSSGSIIRGEAAIDQTETVVGDLRLREDIYKENLERTREGLKLLEDELKNSATLPSRVRKKLDRKKKQIRGKISQLGRIVDELDETVKYAERNIKSAKGFEEAEDFRYGGDDDLEHLSGFLVDMYKDAQREFEDEPELFKSWADGEYRATVLTAVEDFKDVLKNSYVDSDEIDKILDKYELGNGVIDDIEDEHELLRRTTSLLEDYAKGKFPKESKSKKKKARKFKHKHKSSLRDKGDKPYELIIGGGVGETFYTGQFGVRAGPVSLIASVNQSQDKHISTKRTPTSGNGVYGITNIDHINYTPSLGLGLDLNLGRFLVGGGVNSRNYTELVEQNQMKNGIVIKPHSNSESQSGLSYDVHAGFGIGPKNGSKLYLVGGQDSEMGNYAKAQLNFRLNKPRNSIGKRGK